MPLNDQTQIAGSRQVAGNPLLVGGWGTSVTSILPFGVDRE
jgi:hypothetical protein